MTQGNYKKQTQILLDHFGEQLVGGRLSEMASYSDLFEKLSDCIFFVDLLDYQILECNPAVQAHLGVLDEQILGRSVLEFISENDHSEFLKLIEKAKTQNTVLAPFDCSLLDSKKNKKIYEWNVCRLKLADYCEVLQIIAKDVDQARAYESHLKQMSQKDEMTQIPNFRAFQEELKKENERASRYQSPYSVLFCDVDHFKNYNDQNGHPAGDEVLKQIAKLISENIRQTDFCARYGGEEFVVLCRGSSLDAGLQLAEKLRKLIEKTEFKYKKNQPFGFVSLSIGVAEFPMHGQTSIEVVESADQSVYLSKKNGRNQVSSIEPKFIKKSS